LCGKKWFADHVSTQPKILVKRINTRIAVQNYIYINMSGTGLREPNGYALDRVHLARFGIGTLNIAEI
jgi:hypothetical protein